MSFETAKSMLAGAALSVFGEPVDLAGPGEDSDPVRIRAIFDEEQDLVKVVEGFAGGVTVALIPMADIPGLTPGARWKLTRYPDTAKEVWILGDVIAEESGFWRATLNNKFRPVPS